MENIMQRVHWDINLVNTKQRDLNFILGERGVGKTFTTLEWCVKRALKHDEEFVYMRRYESELKDVDSLLSPLPLFSKDPLIQSCSFKVKGNDFYADDKLIGHWVALSTSNHLKGTAFPKVKYLIYDEFLAESGVTRELKKEMFKFYNILETLFRMREFRCFLLANTTSFQCCYKSELKLQLPFGGNEFWYHPKKSILVQITNNIPYREAKMESPVGKLVEGTAYAEYSINNKFYMDSNTFIKKRTGSHYEILNFVFKGLKYGLYISKKSREMIIDYSKNQEITDYVIKDAEMTDEGARILSRSNHPVFKYMRNYYEYSNLYYQNLTIKSDLYGFLYKIL